MKVLRLSETFALQEDFVTITHAVLGQKGSGKSHEASVLAEEMLGADLQVVVLDPTGAWWGLRAKANGKAAGFSIAVFGGEHGDVELQSGAGEVIAEAIATEHFSAVLDLSAFRKGEANRFVGTFLETLYRKNKLALHLVVDEADLFAPQRPFGDEARTLGAMEDIVRRGRIKGIGITMITQRPQVISKNVLSQVDMLSSFRMNHPKDLAAVREWVAVHGDEAQAKKMLAELPTLPTGEAWIWNPRADIFERVKVRHRETYDSGRTPKAGEHIAAPKVLAAIDIERLGTAMAETVARAKENDPRAMKARIMELEKQLAARPAAEVVTKTIERDVIKPAELARIEKMLASYDALADKVAGLGGDLQTAVTELAQQLSRVTADDFDKTIDRCFGPEGARVAREVEANAGGRPLPHPTKETWSESTVVGMRKQMGIDRSESLPRMERAMLVALAQHPDGLSRRKIRIHTGYRDSGAVSAAFARLLREAWVKDAGANLVITQSGLRKLGRYEPLPVGDELRKSLLTSDKLPIMERKMLVAICDAFPKTITRGRVREVAGYQDSGATSAALAHLVALDYVVKNGGELSATPELFG